MKKVTMYTGNPCSFCAAAKALLKTKNVEIEEIDIWADPANAKEMLQRTNGVRTIPQIFIGDHYIGGNDKLQEANRNGELDKIIKENEEKFFKIFKLNNFFFFFFPLNSLFANTKKIINKNLTKKQKESLC